MTIREHYKIGIDVGGTKTEIAVLNTKNEVVTRARCKTERSLGYEAWIKRVHDLITNENKNYNFLDQIDFLGIGLPGTIDPKQHMMTQGNSPMFIGKSVPTDLINTLQLSKTTRTAVDNDANCFLLAELKHGAIQLFSKQSLDQNKDQKNLNICAIGLTLGTGLGGAIYSHGHILRGARGAAGELGHMSIRPDGRRCYCGQFGCAEVYLSGTGIEASYQERNPKQPPLSADEIFKNYRNKDPFCQSTVQEYIDIWVQYLSNLVNIFDPHVFVIGGGLSKEPEIYQNIQNRLSEHCFLSPTPPPILKNQLGGSAGSIGAALLE